MMDGQAEALRLQVKELAYKARFDEIEQLCAPKLSDPDADVVVMARLGLESSYYDRGDYARAKEEMTTALALAREQASPRVLVEVLCSAAFEKIQETSLDGELEAFAQEALALAETHQYARGTAFAHILLAHNAIYKRTKATALHHLDQALTLTQQIRDSDLEATAWEARSHFFLWTGKPDAARKCGLRVLSLNRQTGNDVFRCVTLSNLSHYTFSNTYHFRTYEQALAYNQEALALARDLKFPYGELAVLVGLGSTYVIARSPEKAIESLQQALTLAREYESVSYERQALYRLAQANFLLKDYEAARTHLERLLSMANPAKYTLWEIYAHYDLGNAYFKQRLFAEAVGNWRIALAHHKQQQYRGYPYYRNLAYFYIYFAYCQARMILKRKPALSV